MNKKPRKNPNDLTLRNLRALKKTAQSLEARVATLESQVFSLTNPPTVLTTTQPIRAASG